VKPGYINLMQVVTGETGYGRNRVRGGNRKVEIITMEEEALL